MSKGDSLRTAQWSYAPRSFARARKAVEEMIADDDKADVRLVRPVDGSVLGSQAEDFVPLPITDDRNSREDAELDELRKSADLIVSVASPLSESGAPEGNTEVEFEECYQCREKPGSPMLCAVCTHNRTLIHRLKSKLAVSLKPEPTGAQGMTLIQAKQLRSSAPHQACVSPNPNGDDKRCPLCRMADDIIRSEPPTLGAQGRADTAAESPEDAWHRGVEAGYYAAWEDGRVVCPRIRYKAPKRRAASLTPSEPVSPHPQADELQFLRDLVETAEPVCSCNCVASQHIRDDKKTVCGGCNHCQGYEIVAYIFDIRELDEWPRPVSESPLPQPECKYCGLPIRETHMGRWRNEWEHVDTGMSYCANHKEVAWPKVESPLPVQEPQEGVSMIQAERLRQISAEGWTAAHDDTHVAFEMPLAAVTYILHACDRGRWQDYWPWDGEWFKPKDMVHGLVRAAALLAAEIDRILRENKAHSNSLNIGRPWTYSQRKDAFPCEHGVHPEDCSLCSDCAGQPQEFTAAAPELPVRPREEFEKVERRTVGYWDDKLGAHVTLTAVPEFHYDRLLAAYRALKPSNPAPTSEPKEGN